MCQLAAYVGDRPIAPLLLRSLEFQEPYFGAHATGMAVVDSGRIRLEKDFGHVARVRKTTGIDELEGTAGIAHSRYNQRARDDPRYNTRGMAHPFLDDSGEIALMHNGGISNYEEHWERLRGSHKFTSYSPDIDAITDSEVAVHMLGDAVAGGMSVGEALRWVAPRLTGSFLLACVSADHPEAVWIANWHQPCYVGVGEEEAMFCSSRIGFGDVGGDLDRVFEPPKNSLIRLTRGEVEVAPLDPGRRVPDLRLDGFELARRILGIVGAEEIDFRNLWYALDPEGWAASYGIAEEEWRGLRKEGVSIVNPYIGVIDRLLSEGEMVQRVDRRLEGGVLDTPRFSYRIA